MRPHREINELQFGIVGLEEMPEGQEALFKERKSEDKFEKVYGFPLNKESIEIEEDKIYGFAIIGNISAGKWMTSVGSFPMIYGFCRGIISLMDLVDDESNGEIPDTRWFLNTFFYELDQTTLEPIGTISRARLNSKLYQMTNPNSLSGTGAKSPQWVTMCDLTVISETENIPPLDFEY